MSILDDSRKLASLDPGRMYDAIAGFPGQVRRAVAIGRDVTVDVYRYTDLTGIVVCGMGGSAIGGDLARSLLQNHLAVPMQVCRNYALPASVHERTLVVGSSYSGNTEETLAAFDQAISLNCRLFALTTGGKLEAICQTHGIPYAHLEAGLQPRAALGFSFVPLMLFLQMTGWSDYTADDFLALADFLDQRQRAYAVSQPMKSNPAKQAAERLFGAIPVIYTGPELTDAVGTRIKGQICENAKMLAFANQFPEFNHNELVGWKVLDPFRKHLKAIFLRDREDLDPVKVRMEIVKEVFAAEKIEVMEIFSEGNSRLERMFSLIQFGDWVSFYLAMLNQVDPTPVAVIDFLKTELGKRR
jgi:glucose/mannose-6-phosphate isomerase